MNGFDAVAALSSMVETQPGFAAMAVAGLVLPLMHGMETPEAYLTAAELDAALGVGSNRTRQKYLAAAREASLVESSPAGPRGIRFTPGFRAVQSSADSALDRRRQSSADSASDTRQSSADSAPDYPDVVVVEEVVDIPPIVPHEKFKLHTVAALVLTEDPFDGFRSALEDYLKDRVPTDRQNAYVRTVQSWIQMAKPPFRDLMKEDQWRTMVAAAINKLMAIPPEEEPKIYTSAKGVIGSTDALRQAVRYELTQANKEPTFHGRNGSQRRRAPARFGTHSRDPEEVLRGLED